MGLTQSKRKKDAAQGTPTSLLLKRFVLDLEPWEKLHLLFGTLALISSAATNLTYPRLIGSIIDSTSAPSDNAGAFDDLFGLSKYINVGNSTFKRILLTAVPIYIIGSISSYVRVYNFQRAKYLIAKRYRIQMYRSIILQGLTFFHVRTSGALINSLVKDCQEGPTVLIDCFAHFLRACNSLFGGSFNLFSLSPKLAGISMLLIPLFATTAITYSRALRKLRTKQSQMEKEIFGYTNETLSTMDTVKYFATEDYEIDRFVEMLKTIDVHAEMVASADGRFFTTILAGVNVCMLVIMYLGSEQMTLGIITPGNLASFALYGGMIGLGASSLSKVVTEVTKASVALKTIYELNQKEIVPPGGNTLNKVNGKIEFKNVVFSYPTRKDMIVFKNLSFTVAPGEVVAIVGVSGAGKSTLISLFATLFDPDEGSVYLDDVDVSTLDSKWFRKSVYGIVTQEPVLFTGTIFDNIRYGCEDATKQQVYEAAMKSNVHDFIVSLPDKYDTIVGQKGVMLSIGQKQRIAIARSIVRNPPILILDEATSALDAGSESIVQGALERAMDGRTVLMVTHRESNLKRANKILVLDKGEVVANGNLAQISKHESYKRIFNVS